MLRLLGHLLPENKNIRIALTEIFGIGKYLSLTLLNLFKISPILKISEIESKLLKELFAFIEEDKNFEIYLRKTISSNINRLQYIKAYRGYRHLLSLPTKGQRTRTNAKTCKKKKINKPTGKNSNKKIWKNSLKTNSKKV